MKYFAYPFGSSDHYNENTINIAKEYFNLAFSNYPGLIHKESNPYELPRFLVRDWCLSDFKYKIEGYFNYGK